MAISELGRKDWIGEGAGRLCCSTMNLMPMKVRELIRLFELHGWVEIRSKGSHRHFKHPERALLVTAPGQQGKELAPGTLNAKLKKQA